MCRDFVADVLHYNFILYESLLARVCWITWGLGIDGYDGDFTVYFFSMINVITVSFIGIYPVVNME